ncbi:MAG: site-specific DNA-methyltransferase [Chloroflexota bacterium]|nr:site-specific DNA-methyltransferase [Chloroflexota bacterium]
MTALPPAPYPNRTLCQGDNLPFLRALPNESIHLIATDPPFNKNRDFYARDKRAGFRDKWSWETDLSPESSARLRYEQTALWAVIETARETHSQSMSAYLCWLSLRTLEMRRVLRADGSLYLHIDGAAQAYVKLLLDALFGAENCRNQIVWHYKTGGVSQRWFSRKHDIILFYSKSDRYTFHPQQEKSYLKHKYGFANVEIEQDARGYFRCVAMRDVWDIPALRGNQPEAAGYPTQKPLALYERIIRASSNPGDIVLDPFCGSGTTAVAAERLGRQWIAMERWGGACAMLGRRMSAEGLDAEARLQTEA